MSEGSELREAVEAKLVELIEGYTGEDFDPIDHEEYLNFGLDGMRFALLTLLERAREKAIEIGAFGGTFRAVAIEELESLCGEGGK